MFLLLVKCCALYWWSREGLHVQSLPCHTERTGAGTSIQKDQTPKLECAPLCFRRRLSDTHSPWACLFLFLWRCLKIITTLKGKLGTENPKTCENSNMSNRNKGVGNDGAHLSVVPSQKTRLCVITGKQGHNIREVHGSAGQHA